MRARIDAAAALLLALRKGERPALTHFPQDCRPQSESEAYAIQDEVARRLGLSPAGWKATLLDASSGLSAPVFAPFLRSSPAHLDSATTATRGTVRFGIEPEIAFTLGRDLPPRSSSYQRNEVLEAIASAHAALEICVCRFARFDELDPLERIADNFMNEALIIGPACGNWRQLDFAAQTMRFDVDGTTLRRGAGGHPLGDPLLPMVWIANHFSARGRTLAAGQTVTTGSHAGIQFAGAGQSARVEFAALGAASISC